MNYKAPKCRRQGRAESWVVCRFMHIPEEKSKEVPWPFRLDPVNALRTKAECFSAVSQEELRVSLSILFSLVMQLCK